MEVATAAVHADEMMAGKIMAEKYGGNSIKEWAEDDAMVIHV